MIDFTQVREKEISWQQFTESISKEDLVNQTNQQTEKMLEIITGCTDADVTFQPVDPDAHDPYAESENEDNLAWTLGHVIVHLTASSEESAFLAAELARGVELEARRSRFEVPWQEITKIEECRQRLEESRRMLLASLDIWPDDPALENSYQPRKGFSVTPIIRFLLGQSHADSHLAQIAEIVRQAKEARALPG